MSSPCCGKVFVVEMFNVKLVDESLGVGPHERVEGTRLQRVSGSRFFSMSVDKRRAHGAGEESMAVADGQSE
jgi:hypothetical protein